MNDSGTEPHGDLLDLVEGGRRAGFRLARFEVYNWGTFHHRVWTLHLDGNNGLLTGDIGSGKSTLVDGITTLLVPPQRITYNEAAGAEARERTLRSYVVGHHKTERGEAGLVAKPVALRDATAYSVILVLFVNEELRQLVTLAQVFWHKDEGGQPARLYVVSDAPLSIAQHFSGFGSSIADLRRRLRGGETEVYESFPPYGAAYRRRFGIENEQALNLFYQTVSMKTVGNLTDFVREHMLEAFPVGQRIDALIAHFDDLNRAHAAVLKAKDQISLLSPMVADCDEHAALSSNVASLRRCRDALRPWFADHKADLLRRRLELLHQEMERREARIAALVEQQHRQRGQRDHILQAIQQHGGDRIERIKQEIRKAQTDKDERQRRAEQYASLAQTVGLPAARDIETFLENRRALGAERQSAEAQHIQVQNSLTESNVEFHQLKSQHDEPSAELNSLRQRRSNIPRRMLDLRATLCRGSGISEDALPFVGELIQVRPEERDWEGAIERVLHNFGLSILVADADYARIAEWVDRTHLGQRLVYYRVQQHRTGERVEPRPASLVRKIAVRPESAFYAWLEIELARRFDYACCDTVEQFRREQLALTRAGQIKAGGQRHEKDDRHRIDDRSRFVLGWSNEDKIQALEREARDLEQRMRVAGVRIAELENRRKVLQERLGALQSLAVFDSFRDLEWQPLASEIERLERERRQLEEQSDILRTLQAQRADLEAVIASTDGTLEKSRSDQARAEERREQADE